MDKCGALRARQLAKRLVRNGADEARVILGWAPGGDAPFLIEASTCQGGLNLQLPRDELPTEEWFSIRAIVGDLELHERDWAADLLAGYFCQAFAPWEKCDPLKPSLRPRRGGSLCQAVGSLASREFSRKPPHSNYRVDNNTVTDIYTG